MNALPVHEIERLLEACMPSFQARCTRGVDGSLSFQFHSRANPDCFAIVGVRAADCCRPQQIRRLGKLFLEELALATAGRLPARPMEHRGAVITELKSAGQS
ncbi:MAG: hypothetical protein ABWY06_23540 [Pseudomonas sp.]|uniref:hypothetical protein n=1 Tax=Pseudomonas sp. TaxID=306 RepID=UPI003391242E